MVRNTLYIGKCESGRATVCLAKWPVRQGQNFHNDLEAANMVLGYFKRFKTRGETHIDDCCHPGLSLYDDIASLRSSC